jgi:hypothetical protein
MGLGIILGDYFTNASGHPGPNEPAFDQGCQILLTKYNYLYGEK